MIWKAVLVVVKSIITLAKAPGFEAPGTHIEDNLIDMSCEDLGVSFQMEDDTRRRKKRAFVVNSS